MLGLPLEAREAFCRGRAWRQVRGRIRLIPKRSPVRAEWDSALVHESRFIPVVEDWTRITRRGITTVQPGSRIGPYEVIASVGAGGMGEVYRARDTRLGRDVAVKVLPAEYASDPGRLRRFEQEARAVAALSHPNILAVFDAGSASTSAGVGAGLAPAREGARPSPTRGEEVMVHYLVTELLEGESLRDRLKNGGLTVRKAVETAVQIAQGLAAAHEKGIIHRDLKPGNVFVTKDGHVKVLDFGIAKLGPPRTTKEKAKATTVMDATEAGTVLGTVAYMSPEQVRGQSVDHRSDIFSFGCVLYEMLSGRAPFHKGTTAETMAAILHDDPPALVGIGREVPPALEGIVTRCLEKRPEDRFSSARDLGFALQAVVVAVPRESARRSEEPRPYPGLAAFTEGDAEQFFGREEEVASLWRKVPDRKLLALIGPSGAGKTSFLRAGVIPHASAGWRCLISTPGQAPFAGLARALAPAFSGDPDAYQRLLDFQQPEIALSLISRWRQRADHGLLILDQFEELFTLNGEEVQRRFAALLGEFAALDGVHVLLSIRDDFFFRCSAHEALSGVFSAATPLCPLTRQAVADALVKPAAKLGFAFEDEALVEEMVQAVEGGRGALPLAAFAVGRLWEERDREGKRLTRDAYEGLGGVAGALGQHAEATLGKIGAAGFPIVRELFRNLATAQQTRCVVDAEELLSVFPEDRRSEARQVLARLVDARLLTTFDVEGSDKQSHRRVEIVHESLLTAWPRLMRWHTEDEGSAQLRDQLRQAAHLWKEKGRPDDLLWTGTSYHEYRLWRERYPGGLSDVEDDFGRAMVELAGRKRRRRRTALVAAMAALVMVAVALSLLWRRSAEETMRAEARRLVALGRVELDRNPSAALAFARASLEVEDTQEARLLVVQALWTGPPAFFATGIQDCYRVAFSPNGTLLSCSAFGDTLTLLRRDGGQALHLAGLPVMPDLRGVAFTPRGDRLFSWLQGDPSVRIWSVQGGALGSLAAEAEKLLVLGDETVATYGAYGPGSTDRAVRIWSVPDGTSRLLARWRPPSGFRADLPGLRPAALHPSLGSLAFGSANAVHVLALGGAEAGRDVVLGTQAARVREVAFDPDGSRLLSVDDSGEFRLWPLAGTRGARALEADVPLRYSPPAFDASGSSVGWASGRSAFVWNLEDPPDAAPLALRPPGSGELGNVVFDPHARWVAAACAPGLALWSLASPYPRILRGHTQDPRTLAFTADSSYLASCARDGARVWPLTPRDGRQRLIPLGEDYYCYSVSADPSTHDLLVVAPLLGAFLVRPDGAAPKRLAGIPPTVLWGGALDTRKGLAAVGVNFAPEPKDMVIHVADLTSGAVRSFPTRDPADPRPFAGEVESLGFTAGGDLISGGDGGVFRWDLKTGVRTALHPDAGRSGSVALNRAGTSMIVLLGPSRFAPGSAFVVNLTDGKHRRLSSHGDAVTAVAIDASGERIATGDASGAVRVGLASGEPPHLLLGHHDSVSALALSPDGRWVASAAGTEIRLWPMPDLAKPPAHTLPYRELLAKLKSLTNLVVARDPASASGWKVELGPFPGWAKIPEWQP